MNKIIDYLVMDGRGHHSDFDRLFLKLFGSLGYKVKEIQLQNKEHSKESLFFIPWLDSAPKTTLRLLFTAFLRSFRGKKTIGLFFRPADCFLENSLKAKSRYFVFRFFSKLAYVDLLSIVPYSVFSEAEKVTSNWIYDPQLWDLGWIGVDGIETPLSFETDLLEKAKGRKIIMALGRQDRTKGFDFFVDLWLSSEKVRSQYLFVCGGKVTASSRKKADAFEKEGGYLVNRRIEDAEFMRLYKISDLIWCVYAPDYNQSSGIHGRAVQLGIPAVVREQSFIEKLGEQIVHPSISISFGNTAEAEKILADTNLQKVSLKETEQKVKKMQERSLAILKKALK